MERASNLGRGESGLGQEETFHDELGARKADLLSRRENLRQHHKRRDLGHQAQGTALVTNIRNIKSPH